MHLICIFTNSATAQCHIQKMMIISVYTILCGNYVFLWIMQKKNIQHCAVTYFIVIDLNWLKNYCVILFLKIYLWWINEGGDGWEGEHIYCAKTIFWRVVYFTSINKSTTYKVFFVLLCTNSNYWHTVHYIYRYNRSRVIYDRVQNRKYYLMINNFLHIEWGMTRARKFKVLFSFFTLMRASEMFLFSFEFPVLEVLPF